MNPSTRPSQPHPLDQLAGPPIFIVGAPRSGTTWVLDILAAHPQVGDVFESFLFSSKHGLGAVTTQLSWNSEYAAYQLARTGRGTGVSQLISREQMRRDLRDIAGRWLTSVLESDPSLKYLAVKENEAADLSVIAELFPEARFIHVIRDGRDVSASHRAAAHSWAPEMTLGRRSMYSMAKSWKHRVSDIRGTLAALDNPSTEVRYEQLQRNQECEQQRLFDFCGIRYGRGLEHEILHRSAFERHTVTGSDSFRGTGRSGAWGETFRWFDRWLFMAGAGDALIDLGYESTRLWPARRAFDRP